MMYTYFCEECDKEFSTQHAATMHEEKNPTHTIDQEYKDPTEDEDAFAFEFLDLEEPYYD